MQHTCYRTHCQQDCASLSPDAKVARNAGRLNSRLASRREAICNTNALPLSEGE
jgi:hypothetical protein